MTEREPRWVSGLQAAHKRIAQEGTIDVEAAIRFHVWAMSMHRFPTCADIVKRWGCSRATAYRYRNALANAYGVIPPPQEGAQCANGARSSRERGEGSRLGRYHAQVLCGARA